MIISLTTYFAECLQRIWQIASRNPNFRKVTRISMVKIWLFLVLLTLTVLLLINIKLDIKESGYNRKILTTQSLAKVIIGRLSNGLNLLENREGTMSTIKNTTDFYGVHNGHFVWGGKQRPWFMTNGSVWPQPKDSMFSELNLWPTDEEGSFSDRIVNQLMFMPHNYDPGLLVKLGQTKKIFLAADAVSWGGRLLPEGRKVFLDDQCPVNTCELTFERKDHLIAHAVIFKDHLIASKYKPSHQIWIMYMLECPLHTPRFRGLNRLVNWTATYRHDSDIVTPYEKFVPFSTSEMLRVSDGSKNFAAGKSKKVAWFVSNCAAHNNRLEYAKKLQEYIQVDIYGRCGDKDCPRGNHECFQMLNKEYKFYLAFENSNCHDYITEKLFNTGLFNDILPIVMGARPEDYKRSAPPYSYIHVNDFSSPKELADYLQVLDSDDALYNQYFQWKGSGEFINTRFWCRLCSLLHAPKRPKSYNMAQWWEGENVCEI